MLDAHFEDAILEPSVTTMMVLLAALAYREKHSEGDRSC
jgi:hypothetical protein